MTKWGGHRLLDLDPELGRDLTEPERVAARDVVVPVAVLKPGSLRLGDLIEHESVRGPVLGMYVVEGMLTGELELLGRRCTRLYGRSDYLLFADSATAPLPAQWSFTAERPTSVALLDDRILRAGARWPRITGRLYRAASQQMQRAMLHQAISQIPRIEDRLLALLWCLAERWGTVRADGVFVEAKLTHDVLGRMVGARRPTVSLGLRALAADGAVTREAGGWLLHRGSLKALVAAA